MGKFISRFTKLNQFIFKLVWKQRMEISVLGIRVILQALEVEKVIFLGLFLNCFNSYIGALLVNHMFLNCYIIIMNHFCGSAGKGFKNAQTLSQVGQKIIIYTYLPIFFIHYIFYISYLPNLPMKFGYRLNNSFSFLDFGGVLEKNNSYSTCEWLFYPRAPPTFPVRQISDIVIRRKQDQNGQTI